MYKKIEKFPIKNEWLIKALKSKKIELTPKQIELFFKVFVSVMEFYHQKYKTNGVPVLITFQVKKLGTFSFQEIFNRKYDKTGYKLFFRFARTKKIIIQGNLTNIKNKYLSALKKADEKLGNTKPGDV